jgi:DNA (cytosine-5)-methyltransferase 1
MLTIGSLFSGVGGFDLGLERTGHMQTVWFCEQDEFCQRVLAKHWPGVPCHPDVRALVANTGRGRLQPDGVGRGLPVAPEGAGRGEQRRPASIDPAGGGSPDGQVLVPVPYVDVLCGGFPCQDLSYAGRGAGLDGERSGLWIEYARLIRELRPRYVIVENVSALLARGLGRVLGDLAACGYDAEWDCIPASAVGAPHRRDRVWLVAYPARDLRAGAASGGTERERAWSGGEPRGVADADGSGRLERRGSESVRAQLATAERCGEVANAERPGLQGLAGSGSTGERRAPGEPAGVGQGRERQREPQPDVGRVADELSAGLDGGRLDVERSRYQEARAAGASHAEAMRAVREHGTPAPTPPGLLEARGDHRGLCEVPPGARRAGCDQADEEAEGLHDLRGDLHELQPLAGQDLLEAMSQRSWPPRGHEALGWWDVEPPVGRVAHGVPKRVDRLRSLGNALVPQIAEWIGRRIIEHEEGRLADAA